MKNRNEELLQKAERIFKANIYEASKYPWGKYRMISPGKNQFTGIWDWDSAFHAIGMTYFDMELAKEQILGFFQFQREDGMLPDVIWETGEIGDYSTKPPVMAYATAFVYKKCKDKKFLADIYPKLVKEVEFWNKKRKNGDLFHYDADDKDNEMYLEWVGWESGWDDSPRWDNAPQNHYAIDLNCFMVLAYRSLAYISKELSGSDEQMWKEKELSLSQKIENTLWNEELQSYTDYNFKTDKFSPILTPASFMPLFVGIASKERAVLMNEIAKKHFMPGMPTVAYDNPTYSTTYWRGPCWLNTAYFAAKGLKDYGFSDTANTVRDTILDWVYNDDDYIHENYNSTTGEGLYYPEFSWSCVFLREFIVNF